MPPKRKSREEDDDDEWIDDGDEDEHFDVFDNGAKKNLPQPKKLKRGGQKSAQSGRAVSSSRHALDDDEDAVFRDYSTSLTLKRDHDKRPLWVTPDNLIILEAFSALYKQAYDFVVAIAEPESRPEFIHCYRLTENSLYAAVAVYDTESIIKFLSRLCKTELPEQVTEYIRECTYTFGKAKIVLKDNCFYIESKDQEILKALLKNPVIRNARVQLPSEQSDPLAASSASAAQGGVSGHFPAGAAASGVVDLTQQQEDGFLISAAVVDSSALALDYSKLGMEEMDEEEGDDLDEADLGEEVLRMTSGFRNRPKTVSFMIAQNAVQVRRNPPCSAWGNAATPLFS
jgi:DNA excision repair protein ERCC-3